MMRGLAAGLVALALAVPVLAAEEPAGYRMDHYRDPVPETLSGATVVDTDAAIRMWRDGKTVFVDVFPAPPAAREPAQGHDLSPAAPRLNSRGLCGCRMSASAPCIHRYRHISRTGLAAATDGDRDRPVLFFCLMDCWMSWNAAKRALEMGYTNVVWFPDGTDGWEFEDQSLEEVQPFDAPAQ